MLLKRNDLPKQIIDSIESSPITILPGPRQCGKTTIARSITKNRKSFFFDLENPSESAGLKHSPMLMLESLEGLVVLDEIQRMPEY